MARYSSDRPTLKVENVPVEVQKAIDMEAIEEGIDKREAVIRALCDYTDTEFEPWMLETE